MRHRHVLTATALLAVVASPAAAEQRWLGCKFTDQRGATLNFSMVFDDLRNTAALFDRGTLVEGTGTSITFQSIRTRFPAFALTYNRNNGALAVTPQDGFGGILNGECRRTPPPPGAPGG